MLPPLAPLCVPVPAAPLRPHPAKRPAPAPFPPCTNTPTESRRTQTPCAAARGLAPMGSTNSSTLANPLWGTSRAKGNRRFKNFLIVLPNLIARRLGSQSVNTSPYPQEHESAPQKLARLFHRRRQL